MASFPLQGGMSQALLPLVRGQHFQSDLLDSQQAVSSCLEDRIPASTDNPFEADGRVASQVQSLVACLLVTSLSPWDK